MFHGVLTSVTREPVLGTLSDELGLYERKRRPYPSGMTQRSPFRYFKTSSEIIRLAVMLYVRFPLSLRNVEDLLHERGIEISHETVRFWWNQFGPLFAAEIRRKRASFMRTGPQWRWHLDEVFVKINASSTTSGRPSTMRARCRSRW